jgi:hypothetical protein
MQRKSEEQQPKHSRKRCESLGLRGHTTAKRAAPGNQGQIRKQASRFGDGSANSGVGERGRIRTLSALLHKRELKPESSDPAFREPDGDVGH